MSENSVLLKLAWFLFNVFKTIISAFFLMLFSLFMTDSSLHLDRISNASILLRMRMNQMSNTHRSDFMMKSTQKKLYDWKQSVWFFMWCIKYNNYKTLQFFLLNFQLIIQYSSENSEHIKTFAHFHHSVVDRYSANVINWYSINSVHVQCSWTHHRLTYLHSVYLHFPKSDSPFFSSIYLCSQSQIYNKRSRLFLAMKVNWKSPQCHELTFEPILNLKPPTEIALKTNHTDF